MDMKRKKQLIEEYKNRKPEMGIISFHCVATGEVFLGASKDINADFNSTRFKLNSNYHPNKRLLELWNRYGESKFELSVIEELKYKGPSVDYSEKLEKILVKHLELNGSERRIWK